MRAKFYPLDQREESVKRILGEESLKLDPDDPRPKLLYLVAKNDFKGAFEVDDMLGIGEKANLETLSKTHDILYKVITSADEVCAEIAKGSEIGELKSLIINAHGGPDTMDFSNDSELQSLNGKLYATNRLDAIPTTITTYCFTGLSPDAEISLKSCSTGSTTDGIAAAIARLSNRTVWAPSIDVSGYPYSVASSTIPARISFTDFSLISTSIKSIALIILNTLNTSKKKWVYLLKLGANFLILKSALTDLISTDVTCQFLPDGSRNCPPSEEFTIDRNLGHMLICAIGIKNFAIHHLKNFLQFQ
jgi:hypothetical protein